MIHDLVHTGVVLLALLAVAAGCATPTALETAQTAASEGPSADVAAVRATAPPDPTPASTQPAAPTEPPLQPAPIAVETPEKSAAGSPEAAQAAADEVTAPSDEQQWVLDGLPSLGPAPELRNETWLNSEPLRLADLRGKVVLLDMWTFG